MKIRLLIGLGVWCATMVLRAADPSLPEQYLAVYLKINVAEQAERNQDLKSALADFGDCYQRLLDIQKVDPDWQKALVLHRLDDVKAKILQLGGKVNPPAPGTTAVPPMTFAEMLRSRIAYPWKENIIASEFWIGEDGSKASAWTADVVRENGGDDSPYDRSGYAAGGHASRVNPFYVALPFNDLAHPDLAQKWVPKGWARAPKNGKPVSACKDRWVELKNVAGEICYAQWNDAGPGIADKAEYVFGNQPPGKAGQPGIDLSPAVATYLGLTGDAPRLVSWRFVEDADVRPGQWLKLDEQAVIYLAMHLQHKD